MPGANEPVLFKVTVVLFPGISEVVPKLTVVPAGFRLADKAIAVENPFNDPVFKVAVPLDPVHTATAVGLLNTNVEVGAACMVKLKLEIS